MKPGTDPLRVGVIAVQGAVSEHVAALRRAADAACIAIDVVHVRTPEDLEGVAGVVLPGGESTTISRLLRSSGLQEPVIRRARAGDLTILGTCAGLILLATDASHDVADKDIELLGLIDCTVDRNAFGRQRESFQADLDVDGIGTLPAVFIRAPSLTRVGADVHVLARVDGDAVMVQSGRVIGAAFHPELTPDTRVHERFLAAASGG